MQQACHSVHKAAAQFRVAVDENFHIRHAGKRQIIQCLFHHPWIQASRRNAGTQHTTTPFCLHSAPHRKWCGRLFSLYHTRIEISIDFCTDVQKSIFVPQMRKKPARALLPIPVFCSYIKRNKRLYAYLCCLFLRRFQHADATFFLQYQPSSARRNSEWNPDPLPAQRW